MSDEAVRKEFEAWFRVQRYNSEFARLAYESWQASRSAAMSRMEEFLQKLAWTKEDIESWRNWMSH